MSAQYKYPVHFVYRAPFSIGVSVARPRLRESKIGVLFKTKPWFVSLTEAINGKSPALMRKAFINRRLYFSNN